MRRIQVLIVDDSAVIRRILREAFSSEASFEIVGTASNGRIAVGLVDQLRPDLVTLDVEMPEMNGLQALRQIRERHPRLPIIMFSTQTRAGAEATIEALSHGASDYVAKPADAGSFDLAVQRIREQLLPKAKALCAQMALQSASLPLEVKVPNSSACVSRTKEDRINVIAIGTSTGGPNALAAVIPHLPSDLEVPVLIVQHMPPLFTRFLAERLSASSRIPVREAVAGRELLPGECWIAPGDYHVSVFRDGKCVRLRTDQTPPENSCRPSVDVLFRSVAQVYGTGVLAVVMTGMGQDGLSGCEQVRKRGGQIIVQDENSSVVWGMPGFVARAGLADRILPLQQIGPEIVKRVLGGQARRYSATLGRC